jgi:hypothetical protein
LTQHIQPHLLSKTFPQRPAYPDPWVSWLKMSLNLPWTFINFRYGAAVFWDVMGARVLTQFAGAFVTQLARRR